MIIVLLLLGYLFLVSDFYKKAPLIVRIVFLTDYIFILGLLILSAYNRFRG